MKSGIGGETVAVLLQGRVFPFLRISFPAEYILVSLHFRQNRKAERRHKSPGKKGLMIQAYTDESLKADFVCFVQGKTR